MLLINRGEKKMFKVLKGREKQSFQSVERKGKKMLVVGRIRNLRLTPLAVELA